MSFFAQYPVKGGSGGGSGVTIYPNLASFPPSAPNGTLAIDSSTGILYEFLTSTNTWVILANPATLPDEAIGLWLNADGATKTFVHNLNSTNIFVQILDNTGTKIEVNQIQFTDANTVVLTADIPPPTYWTILLKAISGSDPTVEMAFTWSPSDGAVKTITHGFNSLNIMSQVMDNTDTVIDVESIVNTNANTTVLTSSSAPTAPWTVLLQKIV